MKKHVQNINFPNHRIFLKNAVSIISLLFCRNVFFRKERKTNKSCIYHVLLKFHYPITARCCFSIPPENTLVMSQILHKWFTYLPNTKSLFSILLPKYEVLVFFRQIQRINILIHSLKKILWCKIRLCLKRSYEVLQRHVLNLVKYLEWSVLNMPLFLYPQKCNGALLEASIPYFEPCQDVLNS